MSLLWRRRRELHPDQVRAIDGLSVDGKYLLVGPPGSGKTSILLHRGQYLRLPPHNLTNIRLITFARTLREFIAVNGDDRFPPELITTVREFLAQIFQAYHERMPEFDDGLSFVEQNRQRALAAASLIRERGKKVRLDALLVDEVQDLSKEEVELFGSLSERIMFVGDLRQRLFDAAGGMDGCLSMNPKEIELRHHFRISQDICNVADSILIPGDFRLSDYCHYQGPTPSAPLTLGNLSREAQIDALKQSLDLQVDTYNDPGDLIGVITWKKDDCEWIFDELQATRFGDAV